MRLLPEIRDLLKLLPPSRVIRVGALVLSAFAAVCPSLLDAGPRPSILGLPFSRFHSYEEIGEVSQSARLAFDPIGRIAVVDEGACVVLNDNAWIDIASRRPEEPAIMQIAMDADGQIYYGAFGSWGLVDITEKGLLRARSMAPKSPPKWVTTTTFDRLYVTSDGVYFAGWNGVVFLDPKTQESLFFEAPVVANVLALGDKVFVFSHSRRLQSIDLVDRTLRAVDDSALEGALIAESTELDDGRILVATRDRRLFTFDGEAFEEWSNDLGPKLDGRILAMKRLTDGNIAIGVTGEGLFILSHKGNIITALTDSQHHRIMDFASREPGVLWLMTESGVEKVLYQSPVGVFSQRLGVPISWPQIVRWKGRVVIASGGVLYETVEESDRQTAQFHQIEGLPEGDFWGIASTGDRMLVGNMEGVFARHDDGSFERVVSGIDVGRIVMLDPDHCVFIGATEIGALRWEDGRWTECAERVSGLGYPAVAHEGWNSAWIELAGGRVARLALREGAIETRIFDKFPWDESEWINVSVVGDMVVLTAGENGGVYFDERTESVVESPDLKALLEMSPYAVTRVERDDRGTLWVTHVNGVLTIEPEGDGWKVDNDTFSLINDPHLNIHIHQGGDVWFSTAKSLYHVERRSAPMIRRELKPVVVSVERGSELRSGLATAGPSAAPLSFPYGDDNLTFRFFAGSYSMRRPPGYEFRLSRTHGDWTAVGGNSLLTLPNLREGSYRMEVRFVDADGPVGVPLSVDFTIRPPLLRTWYAYAAYGIIALVATIGLMKWFVNRANVRNAELEKLVRKRTGELTVAMEKLNEETRNAATLAERDRLAAEIHDSVQQGLSGVVLQLDATLKLPAISDDVRSRIDVARNMVSFTRHEVQHAVWDMESPLLNASDLGEALRKIASLVSPVAALIHVRVEGEPFALSSSTKHHLLRIAQEAVTNAVRHASPGSIEILLAYDPEGMTLTVSDDGCGFRPNDVLVRGIGHFGLRGLRGRAGKIGASLEILSAPGEGTTVRVVLPTLKPIAPESHAVAR